MAGDRPSYPIKPSYAMPPSYTIAVVDADAAIRRLLRLYFTRLGYETLECTTGEEAREKLQTNRWQVAIIDRRLPDMDGFTLCNDLKSSPDFRKKYIIMLTGEDELDDKVEGLDLGADDYVTKPFQPKELMARVRAATRLVERPTWAKVFISYAREDAKAATAIYEGLLRAGFRPWLDKSSLQAGEAWRSAIAHEIEASHAAVVCLSTIANEESSYVQEEIRLILEKGERCPPGRQFVIPVRLDDCDIPPRLVEFHCVDYADGDMLRQIIASLSSRE